MKLYSLKIKDTVFKIAVVDDEKRMKKGLSGSPKLGKNKGLLFDFISPQLVVMNMQKMAYPIDMIFIGEDRKVIDVRTMRPGDIQTSCDDCRYVLEVNKGEGKSLEKEIVKFSLIYIFYIFYS